MPPPEGSALETAGLLALEREDSSPTAPGADGGATAAGAGATAATGHGPGGLAAGGAGDDGDDGWELQKSLLLSEYREGERGMADLMENLIAVIEEILSSCFVLWTRCWRTPSRALEALLAETNPLHLFSVGDFALGHMRQHRTCTASRLRRSLIGSRD